MIEGLEQEQKIHGVMCDTLERSRKRVAETHMIVKAGITFPAPCDLVDVLPKFRIIEKWLEFCHSIVLIEAVKIVGIYDALD